MDVNEYKIVEFDKYCKTCKFRNVKGTADPCDDCLSYPVNLNSRKPVRWKSKED